MNGTRMTRIELIIADFIRENPPDPRHLRSISIITPKTFTQMNILVINIKQLLQVEESQGKKRVSGKEMSTVPSIENAYLFAADGLIKDFGKMDSISQSEFYNEMSGKDVQTIDATGKLVLPSFCDSHTHIVYAGSREIEYIDKIKGLSYEEIAKRGGGILNSAKRMQVASETELVEQALVRLEEIKSLGTGAVEIKSGYGLTTESELKMLRVIKKLKELTPLTIKSTFLGAHAVPAEYKQNQSEYVDIVVNEMIPKVGDEGLADYIDVFCDRGFFTREETERIIEAGRKYGMRAKLHANELDFSGGIQAGVKYNALSVDHLEFTGDEEIEALLNSETMPALLPGAAFFLEMEYPPARKMIDAGLPVAMASDYNPGSSPSGNMQFVMSLGCIKMKMLPEEAIHAVTINGAYAMGVESEMGTIKKGKKANFFITKEIPTYAFIPYSYGSDNVEKVILNGEVK